MDTRALMWIILGAILVLGGVTASLREGKAPASQPSRGVVERLAGEKRPVAERAVPESGPVAPQQKKFDTGFSIDPIKGLRRKDDNADYLS